MKKQISISCVQVGLCLTSNLTSSFLHLSTSEKVLDNIAKIYKVLWGQGFKLGRYQSQLCGNQGENKGSQAFTI